MLCALLLVAFFVDLRLQPEGARVTRAVDDLTQLTAAAIASAAAFWRVSRSQGRFRTSWLLIGLGAGIWALGEAVWSYYEVLADTETPFPSMADLGYLLFPVFTAAGIVVRPSRAFTGRAPTRIALDVSLVVMSLFTISWATVMGQIYRGANDVSLTSLVSLAYPASDVALLTVVVIVISYARNGNRLALGVLGSGLIAFAIADSGFAYLTAVGKYSTGNPIDLAWVGGFLIMACAPISSVETETRDRSVTMTPRVALVLPYLPAGVGVSIALWRLATSRAEVVLITCVGVTLWLLVLRQLVAMLDNHTLMARVTHQAMHDALTGLANRALLADRLQHALELHRRDMRPVALVLIDLDDFKAVNDSLGHPAGDELLIRVTERLKASTRAGDTLARLGGDEFAIVFEDEHDAGAAAARIIGYLEQPVSLGHRVVPVGASVGVAILAADDLPLSADDLLRRADVAMYQSKRAGKGRVSVYSAGLESDQLDMRSVLAVDIAAGQIDVAVQPILSVDGGHYGMEALARWTYNRVAVCPGTFLPIAVQLGAAAALDEVVIRKAVAAASLWPDLSALSVNVSAEALGDPGFAGRALAILAERHFPAHRLIVEVLEDSLVENDATAVLTLQTLRSSGVRIAVDDFGAGFANLSRLHQLRPDIIKIDRSLTAVKQGAPQQRAVLNAVAELAHCFDAFVIAEGIETETQLSAVTEAGCDAVQGYLLGVPALLEQQPDATEDKRRTVAA